MNPQDVQAVSAAALLGEAEPERAPVRTESPVARGAWTHDVEALCRALDARQRAPSPGIAAKEK